MQPRYLSAEELRRSKTAAVTQLADASTPSDMLGIIRIVSGGAMPFSASPALRLGVAENDVAALRHEVAELRAQVSSLRDAVPILEAVVSTAEERLTEYFQHHEDLDPVEFARTSGLPIDAVYLALDRMAEKGWVERES